MAALSLIRLTPLLRNGLHHRVATGVLTSLRRTWCTGAASHKLEENVSPLDKDGVILVRDPPKFTGWDDPDYRKWKDMEAEILKDVEPILTLTKEILHSKRYLDGQRLTVEDQKAVVERLLAFHPSAEDKIGNGFDYIMVDRHPQFRQSRCLFVVRVDCGWIDFSYQKCLRAYIREKYPSYAERFIKEHFKRGSG